MILIYDLCKDVPTRVGIFIYFHFLEGYFSNVLEKKFMGAILRFTEALFFGGGLAIIYRRERRKIGNWQFHPPQHLSEAILATARAHYLLPYCFFNPDSKM